MRTIILASLTVLSCSPAIAQQSLCNPCVDPPTTRPDFTIIDSTVTVTAEDMRNLGITSVSDLISQLPSGAAPTGVALVSAARTILPPGTSWVEFETALRGGVWRQDQAAVAVTLPRANETLVYVLVRQADGSYAATDATRVISRSAFGFFGWLAEEYERYEIELLGWEMREAGSSLLRARVRAWREGQRYTTAGFFLVSPDGSISAP